MKLSVIISNRNDVTMLAITVRSCLEALKAVKGGGEVVIVDNSNEKYRDMVKGVIPRGYILDKRVQLLWQDFPCLFYARDTAAKAAKGQYIACLDGHMLVGHNMFKDMVDFMNRHRDDPKLGFGHAPISWAHQHENKSKHDRNVTECELGSWNTKYQDERKITWKGMPWICRRNWFINKLGGYGALSEHKVSWGGGDILIGTKPWLLGFENWAIPTSSGIHIGPFPNIDGKDGSKYRVYSVSGNHPAITGYLVALYVLGGVEAIRRNKEAINRNWKWYDVDKFTPLAIELGTNERKRILRDQVMSFEEYLKNKPWESNAYKKIK